ncbi:EamA family transporter [Patescibacteria group bacterium]
MTWLFFAILSYFLTAIVVVVDKFLVSNKTRSPLVYTFFIGILNSVAFLIWPFDFSFLSFKTTLVALLSGVSFFIAIFFLYSSMMKGAISRAASMIGGISPIIILFLSYLFFDEKLPVFWFVAFAFLILGSFLLSAGKGKSFSAYVFVSAIFFALNYFFLKMVYFDSSFLNGFVWTRIGMILPALLLLFSNSFRKKLKGNKLRNSKKLFLFFVANKTLGAGSFFLLNYSIKLGSVSIVNALQGVQYGVVFIIVSLVSFFFPNVIKESLAPKTIIKKILGIVLISAGIIFLVF